VSLNRHAGRRGVASRIVFMELTNLFHLQKRRAGTPPACYVYER